MSRILVVNPNTNAETTERIRTVGEQAASPGTSIECVTAPTGARILKTLDEVSFAAEVVLSVLNERAQDFDGAVIAAFSDPGLLRAKTTCSIPVVGIAEASMLQAATLSDRFSIITMGLAMPAYLRERAKEYEVGRQLANVRILPWEVRAPTQENYRYLVSECFKAIDIDNAGAVIIGGGPLAGFAGTISNRTKIPTLDGTVCAVRRIERMIETHHLEVTP